MKNVLLIAAVLAFAVSSCTISYPGIATGNTAEKEGTVEKTVWFGIALKPIDLGIEAAAKNGKITKVATIDYSVKAGLFRTTYKVIVTGN
jgi:hypothetical protein